METVLMKYKVICNGYAAYFKFRVTWKKYNSLKVSEFTALDPVFFDINKSIYMAIKIPLLNHFNLFVVSRGTRNRETKTSHQNE